MADGEHTRTLGVVSLGIALLLFGGASFFLFLYPVDPLTPFVYAITAVLSVGGAGFLVAGLRRIVSG